MEEGFIKRSGDACPLLLDLIPSKRDWMVGDSGGGGFGVSEEKKLELRLAPPGVEDWKPAVEENKTSKTSKRGFFDTVESKQEGFLQLKDSVSKTSGKAEKQQSLERKACCPQPSHVNAAGANNNSSETRTTAGAVVGWPPIRSFRKNLASNPSKPSLVSRNRSAEAETKVESSRKGLFVKINMDGIPIGRKVDLNAYDSYEKLSSAVEELFQGLLAAQRDPATATTQMIAKEKHVFTGLLDGSGEYTLVYEDNEGDRMLVGDVPWEMFVSTAKRLRVLKSSELSMLRLGVVSKKRTTRGC